MVRNRSDMSHDSLSTMLLVRCCCYARSHESNFLSTAKLLILCAKEKRRRNLAFTLSAYLAKLIEGRAAAFLFFARHSVLFQLALRCRMLTVATGADCLPRSRRENQSIRACRANRIPTTRAPDGYAGLNRRTVEVIANKLRTPLAWVWPSGLELIRHLRLRLSAVSCQPTQ